MPLQKGKSKKAFVANVRHSYKKGKPLKQALAIACAVQRGKKGKGRKR